MQERVYLSFDRLCFRKMMLQYRIDCRIAIRATCFELIFMSFVVLIGLSIMHVFARDFIFGTIAETALCNESIVSRSFS